MVLAEFLEMLVDEHAPALLGGPAIRPAGPPAWPRCSAEIESAVSESLKSGEWGRYEGESLARLQERLKEFFAVEHAITCSSGTVAIELALRGLNIGAGDEVILAGYDFRGNFLDILTVGATPVLVDIDPVTGQLDPARVAAALSDKTRGVIASHLHGGAVDLAALRDVLQGKKIAIIEDACQMPGAPLRGVRAGSGGEIGVISFGGSKLLSAGRGGAILTNRADVVARIRRYSYRGNEAFPLSELQATVLLPQLDTLDALRAIRRASTFELLSGLADFPGLKFVGESAPDFETDYYKVRFTYDAQEFDGLSREHFAAAMQAEGIALFTGFRALHRLHARSRYRQVDELAESDKADTDWLVLHHPLLLEGEGAIGEFLSAVRKIGRNAIELQQTKLSPALSLASPWEVE